MAILKTDTVSGIGTEGTVFEGDITFDSLNYMTLPKGTTTQSNRGRGMFISPVNSGNWSNVISYIQIQTLGEVKDFGDLIYPRRYAAGTSSATRGVIGAGIGPSWPANKTTEYSTAGSGTGKDYTYYTLGFDEQINGWPSFYTYRPGLLGSIKNKYYTVNNLYDTYSYTGVGDFGIYEQYKDNVTGTNRGVFYGNSSPSTVTIIANANPSIEKNFLTIDYEGSSGWKVVAAGSTGSPGNTAPIFSDQTGEDFYGAAWQYHVDKTNQVYSLYEGQYDSANPPNTGGAATVQPIFHVGFNRKENRYVANLVNASDPAPGEIIFGDKMSGIKGFYNIVTLSTDATTAPGKMKELYQVGLSYNISST